MDALTHRLAADSRIAYAIEFGSRARGSARDTSDLDIAIGLEPSTSLSLHELGELIADLECASGLEVDLVVLDEATPALAYRIFSDGRVLLDRHHRVMAERKARAILEYLDFAPTEALYARGIIAAAARGR